MAEPVMAHAKDVEQNTGDQHAGRHHFLVVAYGIQGHINPARTLARRLARTGDCAVTLSIPLSGHRRLFPSSSGDDGEEVISDGLISYIPFSDGKDDGSWPRDAEDRAQRRDANFRSLSAVVTGVAAGRAPVTCMVCTLSMPVVGDVAREHGIPLAVYWIQPATALAVYYHYFHGHGELIAQQAATVTSNNSPACEAILLPGLPHPLRICDMPSFLTAKNKDELSKVILRAMQELFEQLDRDKPAVLVNTFGALEDAALEAVQPYVDVFAVGPAVSLPPAAAAPGADARRRRQSEEEAQVHLFKHDHEHYMEWLDGQPEKSVVYLSFGSLLTYTKRQEEEVLHGLQACRRPYLWVLRKDPHQARAPDQEEASPLQPAGGHDHQQQGGSTEGVVVEWCDQLRVLSHPSVGCFVTHCGWNSTLEAVACGVPMVAAPSWSDQPLNAHLVEREWGVGVRAERDAEGVLTSAELVRCVELVMGDDSSGTASSKVRENAARLKARARDAVATDGPMERSIRSFIKRI